MDQYLLLLLRPTDSRFSEVDSAAIKRIIDLDVNVVFHEDYIRNCATAYGGFFVHKASRDEKVKPV